MLLVPLQDVALSAFDGRLIVNDKPPLDIVKGGVIVKLMVEVSRRTIFWSFETVTGRDP